MIPKECLGPLKPYTRTYLAGVNAVNFQFPVLPGFVPASKATAGSLNINLML